MDGSLLEIERALDERARAALRELPEEVALGLLRDCQMRKVRNPSAYIFVAARKARPGQLKDTIERLQGDLDEKAIAQLRELPPEQAMRILDELAQSWDQVRNPSAYVSTAVKNYHHHAAGGRGAACGPHGANAAAAGLLMAGQHMDHSMTPVMAPSPGYSVGMGCSMALNPNLGHLTTALTAAQLGGVVAGAPPAMGHPLPQFAQAQAAGALPLAALGRSGSVSVAGACFAGLPDFASGGQQAQGHHQPTQAQSQTQAQAQTHTPQAHAAPVLAQPHAGCAPGLADPPDRRPLSFSGMSQRQIEHELECIIARLGLDEIANEALHRVPLETAREILQALDGGVRNPSAFVMSKIRSFQDGMGLGLALTPRSAAPCPFLGERLPDSSGELQRRNEAALERFGADERARNIAREIPPEALYDIFSQLNHNREIRNPSAFIFQACVNYQKQHPQPAGYPSYPSQQPFITRPGATAEQVEEAILRLELDTAAAADMRALPPESAMGILDQVTEGVKNRSAFATTAARRLSGRPGTRDRSRSRSRSRSGSRSGKRRAGAGGRDQERCGQSRGCRGQSRSRSRSHGQSLEARHCRQLPKAEEAEALEGFIKRYTLDEEAAQDLRRSDARNASAWACSAARKLLGSCNLEEAQRRFDLDGTALSCLEAVLPHEAREILDSIDEGLRNPSAFVTAQVRRLHPEFGLAPGQAYSGNPSSCSFGLCPAEPTRCDAEELEAIVRQLGLDERAHGVLHEIPLAKALDILGELRRNWGNVRNPSAYVFNACVKEINHPGPLAPRSAGDSFAAPLSPCPPLPPGAQAHGLADGVGSPLQPAGAPGGSTSAPGSPGQVDAAPRKAEFERAIEKWNLDETALGALLQIPADQALEILNSLDTGVRNPSAFVTTAARKRVETGMAMGSMGSMGSMGMGVTGLNVPAPGGAAFGLAKDEAVDFRRSLQDQVEKLIERSELDEKATSLLYELPLEGALEILGELQRKREQVRNPSAYVFNAGVKFQEKLTHGRQHSQCGSQSTPYGQCGRYFQLSQHGHASLAQRVEILAARYRLDADAHFGLYSLPVEVALGLVERIPDEASDPSDYVRRFLASARSRMRMMGETRDPYSCEQSLAHRAESMARDLGVDESSLATLQTIPLPLAIQVLNRLADSRLSVQNPSAFVISAVKDYRNHTSIASGATPRHHNNGAAVTEAERQLDCAVDRLRLDTDAVEALHALPVQVALAVVASTDRGVRDPSAWVTSAARNALQRGLPESVATASQQSTTLDSAPLPQIALARDPGAPSAAEPERLPESGAPAAEPATVPETGSMLESEPQPALLPHPALLPQPAAPAPELAPVKPRATSPGSPPASEQQQQQHSGSTPEPAPLEQVSPTPGSAPVPLPELASMLQAPSALVASVVLSEPELPMPEPLDNTPVPAAATDLPMHVPALTPTVAPPSTAEPEPTASVAPAPESSSPAGFATGPATEAIADRPGMLPSSPQTTVTVPPSLLGPKAVAKPDTPEMVVVGSACLGSDPAAHAVASGPDIPTSHPSAPGATAVTTTETTATSSTAAACQRSDTSKAAVQRAPDERIQSSPNGLQLEPQVGPG